MDGDRGRPTTWVAFGVFGLVLAEVGTGVAAAVGAGLSFDQARDSFVITNSVIAVSCAVAGLLLGWQRPRNPVGWLLLAAGAFQAATVATAPFLGRQLGPGLPDPVARTVATAASYSWPWSIALCLPLALLLFPDGTLPGRGWRFLVPVVVAEGALFALEVGAEPDSASVAAPWLVLPNYADLAPLWTASEIVNGAVYLAAFVGLAVRYRRGDEQRRRQLLWLLLALLAMLVVLAIWAPAVGAGELVFVLLVIPLVPAAITIAVLRHQLLDIRLVFSRAVLYGLLSAAVIGAYLGLVALADVVQQSQGGAGGSVVATLVIALGFNPVRVRLQRVVDRRLYGDR
ncbi:MAG: two-component sensor histidine kinase, partial [Pseudonocardiales bacterium]|nr:two-component sensor histidine kinase [Pseudonocardiales bacterium]